MALAFVPKRTGGPGGRGTETIPLAAGAVAHARELAEAGVQVYLRGGPTGDARLQFLIALC